MVHVLMGQHQIPDGLSRLLRFYRVADPARLQLAIRGLVRLRPHAHVRGKSAQYKVTYPDGREETVLNVPRYDFNWQLAYGMSVKLPKGSRLRFEFRYDNSAITRTIPIRAGGCIKGFRVGKK